jgi:hypothetical protein
MSDAGQAKNDFSLRSAGALTTGAKDRFVAPASGTIDSVDAVVGTAPTGASLNFQIRKNGVALNPTVGTVAPIATAQNANGQVSASAATIDVVLEPGVEVAVGTVLLIESEQVHVTGTAGSPQPGPSGLGDVYRLTVERGYNSTAAATHNGGTAVTYAGLSIAAGATKASSKVSLGEFVEGDVFDANITQIGSTVAGSDLEVTVGYAEN